MDVNAKCIISIFEASKAKLNYFYNTLDDNLLWLKEILDEAKIAFGSETIALLPKTPGIKRKRPVLSQHNDEHQKGSPTKCSSTFMEEAESKKLKIDDMSTIIEVSDLSILDDTQNNSIRSLRPRKKKSAPRPLKKSKRIINTRANNLNKSIENKNVLILDTPSPKRNNICNESKSVVIDDTITSPLQLTKRLDNDNTLKNTSPVNYNVQPHVAAMIEQLKMSTQKSVKKTIQPNNNILDDVKATLFGKKLPGEHTSSEDEILINPVVKLKNCLVSTPISTITTVCETPQSVVADPIEETMELEDNKDVCNEKNDSPDNDLGRDSGISSDEKHDLESMDKKSNDESDGLTHSKPKENNGRRDTYKVMVQEAELNTVENVSKVIPFLHANNDSPELPFQKPNTNLSSKGPKILKPLAGRNIVSGVKSFINRTMTPPRKTKEEIQQKKEKELEQKELHRQKALDETNLRKQRLLELRKKQRIDREKRLAEQQVLRQEEEEKKRKQMEARNKKIMKNREEIKKQREQEEKKKREIRDQKYAGAGARRVREEEEHQRKVREQIDEEERRCEMLRRKAEYEEQERLKKRQQTEKEEKERFRQLEKEKLLQEERKLRELMEKEKHREEVERKIKEEREKERTERQKQEQRLRQAEFEIAEAKKKRELEAERNSMKKPVTNIQHAAKAKPYSPSTGTLVKAVHKNSPSLMKATVQCQKINVALLPLKLRQSSYTSYDIDDLHSDDSTDDESEPTKRVPSWAQGMELKTQLMHQFYANVDPEHIFVNCMEPCRLDKIFQKNKERYFKRTSSAHWDSPLLKAKVFRS